MRWDGHPHTFRKGEKREAAILHEPGDFKPTWAARTIRQPDGKQITCGERLATLWS